MLSSPKQFSMEKLLHKSPFQPPMVVGSILLSFPSQFHFKISPNNINPKKSLNRFAPIICCSESNSSVISTTSSNTAAPPVIKKRTRHRRLRPGENKGITEEMRFVAMRLRNINGKKCNPGEESGSDNESNEEENGEEEEEESDEESLQEDASLGDGELKSWKPSMEGFLKYLVDSKLVFETVERIVDKSDDVSYAYFRRTGLERSKALSRDLEWFSKQDLVIPEPSSPGVSYAKYLEELADKSAPLFLSHFYNIYFAHIAGGEVIAKQALEKLLGESKELEFFSWGRNEQESFKAVREKLNKLGAYWSRTEKSKCLRETSKAFKFLGQIVRLIIL